MTQAVKWTRLISLGQQNDSNEHEGNNPWIRFSKGYKYVIRQGFKSERAITLPDGQTVQLFSEVCSTTQNIPLFKCTCTDKSLEVKTTTPTQAANSILEMLGVSTNKRWSGPIFFGFLRKDVFKYLCIDSESRITDRDLEESSENNMNADNAPHSSGLGQVCSIPSKAGTLLNWLGVKDFGENLPDIHDNNRSSSIWFYKFQDKRIPLQPGYDARNLINYNDKTYEMSCKIAKGMYNYPVFQCQVYLDGELLQTCIESKPTTALRSVFKCLNIECTRNISGYEFWGLQRQDVIEHLQMQCKKRKTPEKSNNDIPSSSAKKIKTYQYPLLDKVSKTRTRNAGPTVSLKQNAQKDRNSLIHELVKFASFDDVQSFIAYMCDHEPEIVTGAIESSDSFLHEITTKLNIVGPRNLSVHQSAEFILGRTHLSQREYIAARKNLKKANVHLATYAEAAKYSNELNVGDIVQKNHCSNFDCNTGSDCLCASTNFIDTMQRVMDTSILFKKLEFPSKDKQEQVFKHLKNENQELYGNLDAEKRTFFLRETGDNFRGSSKQPTEQMSFNILNLTELISSPYGQLLTSIWRGPETRKYIRAHVSSHYSMVTSAIKNGLTLTTGDNIRETFNVVVFFVADLGHVKETLGKCTCTATFGCYWCEKKTDDWDNPNPSIAPLQTITKMIDLGKKAEEKLGQEPDKSSTEYKKFQQANLSQTGTVLFSGFSESCLLPCGLHLILAHYRYLWKMFFDLVSKRKQEAEIPNALRSIGCGYFAFQIESYYKSKNKYYDGSTTLKMTGNDCKLMENNCTKLIGSFLKTSEKWDDSSFLKMRQLHSLYQKFTDLARDIRAHEATSERVNSFENRAEEFFQKLRQYGPAKCTSKLPYLHILRDHIGKQMSLWYNLLGWGYGYFSCASSEHLNKMVKTLEWSSTNQDDQRFYRIIQMLRIQYFYYTDNIFTEKRDVTCSVCKQPGHTKKNKGCPMHPLQPALQFDDSDDEN